jgi:isopentenyldiphosphate isomerase/intracellular septation protein A
MLQKNELLKNFTIGFLPILAFIIADQFFGPRIGLIVAIIVGLSELVYYYLRFRRIETFVLFDTILIVILAGISIFLKDDLFFKLKPALIELIIAILFGVHAFSSKPVLLLMGKRYMKGMEINPAQAAMMKRMSLLMFWILLVHTVLIIYAAYFWSREVWAFISGGLFYILIGLVFAGQLIYARLRRTSLKTVPSGAQEEWFDILDNSGKVIGKAPRSRVHGDPSLLHASVHVHIFNSRGNIYLQKRSKSKDLYPGYWDTAVGGHVHSGENISDALRRESMEELGIDAAKARPLYRYIMKNNHESELVHSFYLKHEGPFRLNEEEIETGRFWSAFDLKKMTGKNVFTPNLEEELRLLRKAKLL